MQTRFDSGVVYTRRARIDLLEIGQYTLQNWGAKQTVRYLTALQDCCSRLALYPLLGRACDDLKEGLRRMEQGQHIIFYRLHSDGILVSRILHRSMLPELHSMEE
ncbi:MAG TPA: type II toxin-antitoxin system RelE/ParE family toxin [Acidobacteriaceae bacterium]|nr:type II toxin-antitoxin system RelE/ParE family toxin [Acidobacteriaceae bacterium]